MMEIALAIISIAAFAMSAATWILTALRSHKRIKLTLYGFTQFPEGFYLYVGIENGSALPISISLIKSLGFGKNCNCQLIPKKVCESTTKRKEEIISHREFRSLEFPVSVPALGALSGFILFEGCLSGEEDRPTALTFQFHTNRGKMRKMKLPLPADLPEARIL